MDVMPPYLHKSAKHVRFFPKLLIHSGFWKAHLGRFALVCTRGSVGSSIATRSSTPTPQLACPTFFYKKRKIVRGYIFL